ncbi:hypothetical protein DPMN_104804 [Dreissena polymorpha]|uniref:Uncharacterized protein n=1 Tax=Dreissena polymorpha TaxID=45954 RepID=A0A9D4HAN4_DREPO|nr:hypothetical protein DPMN_104804 [Dreissena polymorpha]
MKRIVKQFTQIVMQLSSIVQQIKSALIMTGNVIQWKTAQTEVTKTIALSPKHAPLCNSNVLTAVAVSTNLGAVTATLTAQTTVMSITAQARYPLVQLTDIVVRPCSPAPMGSVSPRNGIVTEMLIVLTVLMNKSVMPNHAALSKSNVLRAVAVLTIHGAVMATLTAQTTVMRITAQALIDNFTNTWFHGRICQICFKMLLNNL